MTHHNVVKIGIMPLAQFKARTLAIAKGRYIPKTNEPKIWFNSLKSLANVLSEKNQLLLKIIKEQQPESLAALSKITGRAPNNVARTLHTMKHYGLIRFKENNLKPGRAALMPEVIYQSVRIDIHFSTSEQE
jgi:hypothetical protein